MTSESKVDQLDRQKEWYARFNRLFVHGFRPMLDSAHGWLAKKSADLRANTEADPQKIAEEIGRLSAAIAKLEKTNRAWADLGSYIMPPNCYNGSLDEMIADMEQMYDFFDLDQPARQ